MIRPYQEIQSKDEKEMHKQGGASYVYLFTGLGIMTPDLLIDITDIFEQRNESY